MTSRNQKLTDFQEIKDYVVEHRSIKFPQENKKPQKIKPRQRWVKGWDQV